ncbi:UPF0518 protein FAM160A1 [Anas platyrhynchos]|uniref:UPF0518 protein FAM160A1 n=1 Tax=Anas platyrhynchos TaxID=8839 RepID=R0LAI1_ANAPL|nr:UPF0518 protein FAM160A1 [Anas platyrhynchos]
MIASTAYLDLFLRSVSETALLKTFLRFVLLHRHDNATILDTLVGRINSNSRLCMVSLSLFRTLLSLNCEDVMLQLVLRAARDEQPGRSEGDERQRGERLAPIAARHPTGLGAAARGSSGLGPYECR